MFFDNLTFHEFSRQFFDHIPKLVAIILIFLYFYTDVMIISAHFLPNCQYTYGTQFVKI